MGETPSEFTFKNLQIFSPSTGLRELVLRNRTEKYKSEIVSDVINDVIVVPWGPGRLERRETCNVYIERYVTAEYC